jgi:hypothetical protein
MFINYNIYFNTFGQYIKKKNYQNKDKLVKKMLELKSFKFVLIIYC